jgi:hypothetical protein
MSEAHNNVLQKFYSVLITQYSLLITQYSSLINEQRLDQPFQLIRLKRS